MNLSISKLFWLDEQVPLGQRMNGFGIEKFILRRQESSYKQLPCLRYLIWSVEDVCSLTSSHGGVLSTCMIRAAMAGVAAHILMPLSH